MGPLREGMWNVGCLFELGGEASSEEEEEGDVGLLLVSQWPREGYPIPLNCKFSSQHSDWVFNTV